MQRILVRQVLNNLKLFRRDLHYRLLRQGSHYLLFQIFPRKIALILNMLSLTLPVSVQFCNVVCFLMLWMRMTLHRLQGLRHLDKYKLVVPLQAKKGHRPHVLILLITLLNGGIWMFRIARSLRVVLAPFYQN